MSSFSFVGKGSFPVANPDLQISGGGGGVGVVIFFLLFGPQFGLIRMEGGGGGVATLDPPLISYHWMSLTSLYEYGRFPLICQN